MTPILFVGILLVSLITAVGVTIVGAGVVDPKQATFKKALIYLVFTFLAEAAVMGILFASVIYWLKTNSAATPLLALPERTVLIALAVVGVICFLVQVSVAIRVYLFSLPAACLFLIASLITHLAVRDVIGRYAYPLLGLQADDAAVLQRTLARIDALSGKDPMILQVRIASDKAKSIEERHRAVTAIYGALAQRRAKLDPADTAAVEKYRQDDMVYQKLLADLRNDAR